MDKLRRHIEQITPLTDEEFEHVKTFFTLKRVRKNQFLLHEGDEVKHEYWVQQGIYKVFYLDNEGKEHIVQFAQENWWMTDYSGYFKKLSADLHKMEHFFRVKLTNGYVSLQERIRVLLSGNPHQRFDEFAKLHPDLLQRIPKKLIAAFLGVSRETLSRLSGSDK
jgi:CRP-like cAMP-binding protein